MNTKQAVILGFLALLTAVVCHLFFSPYGFNPTDDGFVLSSSVRLLHGQIPHADFSSLRPLGCAYLHIPELLINKEHTFLVSRLVFWLELSAIAYVWTLLLLESTNYELRSSKKILPLGALLIFITFLFNAHYFPIAVLHTIDGLLLALIGFYIVMRSEKFSWIGGLFMGYAVLCKQGYAVLIPLLIWLYPQKKAAWRSSFLPGILYVAGISAVGGWEDLVQQLTAHQEIVEVGFLKYALNPWLFGGIFLSWGSRKLRIDPKLPALLLFLFLCGLLVSAHYHGQALLLLFGFGVSEHFFHPGKKRLFYIALVCSWCVSISVGYASIALFSGGLFSLILLDLFESKRPLPALFIPGLILIGITSFVYARTMLIYRDSPRSQLTYPVDGLVTGASGIYTNKRTYDVLRELDSLQERYPGLLVLPDFTACQVFDYKRPLLTEWPNRAEILNEPILEKVTAPLNRDTTCTIAIARYQTALLPDTLALADHREYRVVQYVLSRFKPAGSTRYFQIYRNK